MNRNILAASIAGCLLALPLAAAAQATDNARREAARAKWDSMSPEEKEAAKTKAKAKWDSMTPEEQAAAKKRLGERRAAAKAGPPAAAAAPASAPATK